ncbi:MAG: helix-turn-helix domain-containing protein [Chitinophagaceae bacterium]|jgi:y4mF family transcriptional regulator
MKLELFVKSKRKEHKLSQPELAFRAHVGLRFIRDLEQGKKTLRMDKVNLVLNYFGYELGAVDKNIINLDTLELVKYDSN